MTCEHVTWYMWYNSWKCTKCHEQMKARCNVMSEDNDQCMKWANHPDMHTVLARGNMI